VTDVQNLHSVCSQNVSMVEKRESVVCRTLYYMYIPLRAGPHFFLKKKVRLALTFRPNGAWPKALTTPPKVTVELGC
jgi:hypothetical protein